MPRQRYFCIHWNNHSIIYFFFFYGDWTFMGGDSTILLASKEAESPNHKTIPQNPPTNLILIQLSHNTKQWIVIHLYNWLHNYWNKSESGQYSTAVQMIGRDEGLQNIKYEYTISEQCVHNYHRANMALTQLSWDIINKNLFVEGAKYWRTGY